MRVTFIPQARDGYCLPACAQMALAFHGIVTKQDALITLLEATDEGAPFSRIARIEKYGVRFLPYAMEDFDHAVLVTDANADEVSLLDPATETGAHTVSVNAFLAAWVERDCALAVIRATR